MLPQRLGASRWQFNLRTLLLGAMLIALIVGSYTMLSRERARSAKLAQQLLGAQSQFRFAAIRSQIQAETPAHAGVKGMLSRARLDGMNLREAVIEGGTSAFQGTFFDHADLSRASLTGGAASFQAASFNHAILRQAKLGNDGASFQLASFEDADLSGAVLTGNLQGVSLRHANCTGVTLCGSLQAANLDGAQFQQADLSALRSEDLASCYHDTPPTYDANTKFPDRFDPIAQGWKQVDPASKSHGSP